MTTVLLIGASRGIGRSLASQYLLDGWRVIATARTQEAVDDLRRHGAEAVSLDVTSPAQVNALERSLSDTVIDVAVIVSGVYGPKTIGIEAVEKADFDEVMAANVRGPMELLPVLLPRVEASHGVLVGLSSIMGSISEPTGTDGWLYRVSKSALNGALRLASLTLKNGVCVSVHPGWVRTRMGGSDADLDCEESAMGIRQVITQAQRDRESYNGRFVQWDGTFLSW